MDRTGRLVVPKKLRDRAGLRPGQPLDVRYVDGRIEIEPVAAAVRVEDEGGVLVARTEAGADVQVTMDRVEATREALRDERS